MRRIDPSGLADHDHDARHRYSLELPTIAQKLIKCSGITDEAGNRRSIEPPFSGVAHVIRIYSERLLCHAPFCYRGFPLYKLCRGRRETHMRRARSGRGNDAYAKERASRGINGRARSRTVTRPPWLFGPLRWPC